MSKGSFEIEMTPFNLSALLFRIAHMWAKTKNHTADLNGLSVQSAAFSQQNGIRPTVTFFTNVRGFQRTGGKKKKNE